MSCPPSIPNGLSRRSMKTLQSLREVKNPFIKPLSLDNLVDELVHGDHQPLMKWVLKHEITQETKVKGNHMIPTHPFTDPEGMTMVRFLANACDQEADECFASLLKDFQVNPMILDLASEDYLAIELGGSEPSPKTFSMLGNLLNSNKFDCNHSYHEDEDTTTTWMWEMVSEDNLEHALFALFTSPRPFDLTEFHRDFECGPDDEPKTASVNVLELCDLVAEDHLDNKAKQQILRFGVWARLYVQDRNAFAEAIKNQLEAANLDGESIRRLLEDAPGKRE